ncbi:MAG: hypothetical protein WCH46_07390 [bacterium]
MRAVLFILFFTLVLTGESYSQSFAPQGRRLPPSLERELKLKHGGKVRIVGFTDTLKAQSIIASSIRDSASIELDSLTAKDSAIVTIDSAVSLTDKEWLDSMLAQLPEYKNTPQGIRFHYPADILVETNRKVVPPDSTIASRMDPVTKEDLPLYGDMAMPKPLPDKSLPRTRIEAALGSPYIPILSVNSLVLTNETTALVCDGFFKTTQADEVATKQYWHLGAHVSFLFPPSPLELTQRVPQLELSALTGATKRVLGDSNTTHSLSESELSTRFTIGQQSQLKLISQGSVGFLHDESTVGISETEAKLKLLLAKDIPNSSFTTSLSLRAEYASQPTIDSQLSGTKIFPNLNNTWTHSVNLGEAQLVLEQKEAAPIRWLAGVSFTSGSDASGNNAAISPLAKIIFHPSNKSEFGVSFWPQTEVSDFANMFAHALFYFPIIPSSTHSADTRRIITEPIHLTIFGNYFLSLLNEAHAEIRYVERNNEPVFERDSPSGIFYARPMNTKHLEIEANISAEVFGKDRVRASGTISSSAEKTSGKILPYERTLELHANYEFRRFSDAFVPSIAFVDFARPGHTFTFLNAELEYLFLPAFKAFFRAENIFNAQNDFWSGYSEYPQAFRVGVSYNF